LCWLDPAVSVQSPPPLGRFQRHYQDINQSPRCQSEDQ
jgi:hypothetical protein